MLNTDFASYYQKASKITKIIRYIVLLVFILFAFTSILVFRNDITIENFQMIMKALPLGGNSAYNYNEEFPVNANSSDNVFMLRNNLAVVGNDNISLYELSGQKLFSYNFSYSSPAVDYDKHNIVVYDVTGNELSIFNSFSKIYSESFPYSVRSADINENGLAVLTNEKTYRSALYVYSKNYDKRLFEYYSADSYLTSIALSNNAKKVLATSTQSLDGSFLSKVKLFDVSSEDVLHVKEITNEIPVSSGYSDDNSSIFVITDSGIHFYDDKLNETKFYKFNQSKIVDFYQDQNLIIFTERKNISGNSMKLTCFKKSGEMLFNLDVVDEISDISVGNNVIFALGKNGVYKFENNSKKGYRQTANTAINEKFDSIHTDTYNNCYIVNSNYAVQVDFKK